MSNLISFSQVALKQKFRKKVRKTSVLLSTDLLLLGHSSLSITHMYHLACEVALNLFIFTFLESLKLFLALEDQDYIESNTENLNASLVSSDALCLVCLLSLADYEISISLYMSFGPSVRRYCIIASRRKILSTSKDTGLSA
jgi:hypothetical protein